MQYFIICFFIMTNNKIAMNIEGKSDKNDIYISDSDKNIDVLNNNNENENELIDTSNNSNIVNNEEKVSQKITKTNTIIKDGAPNSIGNNDKICKNITNRKNVLFNTIFQRRDLICKSIRLNYIFWIVSFICVCILSINSETNIFINIWLCICGFLTYCSTIFLGYFSHYVSHYNSFSTMYKTIISEGFHSDINTWYHKIFITILDYTIDFHDVYHHNSLINKKPFYLILEAINNVWMQGGCWIFYIYLFSLNINTRVILLWCLVYSTFHNINYNLMEEQLIHQEHHIDIYSNLGIDIVDVILDSKYDDKNIENINHYAINTVIFTAIILYYNLCNKL